MMEGCADCFSGLGLVDYVELLTRLERWRERVKKLNWERITLVNVWDIAVESIFGIVIRQKTNAFEPPPED
jgi:hypothetical protein